MVEHRTRMDLPTVTRTAQILVAALASGVLFFAIITLVIGTPDGEGMPVVSYFSFVIAAGAIGARLVVPQLIVSTARRQIAEGTFRPDVKTTEPVSDKEKLAQVFMTKTITACALLEGAAFFALIAYLIEGLPACLALAVVLLVGILLHFPTRDSVERWVESESRSIAELRQLGGPSR